MKIINSASNGREIKYSVLGFAAGERHIQLEGPSPADVSPVGVSPAGVSPASISEITIQARLWCSGDVMDLLLLENALRHKFGAGLKLNLELPYLPYARQDRVCAPGQAFSLEVFANILKMLHLNHLVTWDCHSRVGVEMTGATNVHPAEIIQSDPRLLALLQDENSVLVCPDKGAVSRCTDIQEKLNLSKIVFCEKQRDPATGKIYKTDVLEDDLKGNCAVITDDICDGGFTFIKLAEQLRAKNAGKIVLFVTHGIFSKGLEVFDGLIDEVITTNSFAQQEHAKLRVVDFEYNFNNRNGERK